MCHFRECDKEGCACNTGIFYVFLCYGHSYHPERIAPKLDTCPIGGYFQIRRSGGLGPHIKFGGKLWCKVWPSSPNGGYFQIRRSGGSLDLTSSLEANFGVRSGQVHQIRGKTWEVLSPQDVEVGKKSPFWGHI